LPNGFWTIKYLGAPISGVLDISVCLLAVSRPEVFFLYFSVGCQTPKNVCSLIVSIVEPGTLFLEFRMEKNILLLVSAFVRLELFVGSSRFMDSHDCWPCTKPYGDQLMLCPLWCVSEVNVAPKLADVATFG
jgi:hypothetical protein